MGLEKIELYKKDLGFTNEELARRSGIPKSTIDKITAGTSKDPRIETLKAIMNALGRSINDLDDNSPSSGNLTTHERDIMHKYRDLDPHGKEMVDIVLDKEHARVISARVAQQEVIIYDLMSCKKEDDDECEEHIVYTDPAAAGTPLYATSSYERVSIPSKDFPPGADFGIRIKGDSMEPTIEDGSIVWIRQQSDLVNDEIGVFMFDEDEESVCKRAKVDQYGRLVALLSDNESYAPISGRRLRDIRCVGKVVGTYRE